MTLPRIDSCLELKSLAESGVFEGYAAVFSVIDKVGDRIAPGAFSEALASCRLDGRLPPLLWQHDPKEPIGVLRDMREDASGLYVKGELFVADIARAREAYKLLRENVVTGLSIGYRAKGAHREGKARVLTGIELLEVSMVTFPANDFARVARVKSALLSGGMPGPKEFEALLRDAGLSRKQAKGFLAHGYKSLSPREVAEGHDTDGLARAIDALAAVIRNATPHY